MSNNLYSALYNHRSPDSRAYRFGHGEWRTTAQLVDGIGRMAFALTTFGVEAGDRVSFKLEKFEEVLLLAHACLQIGAVLHPLNTAYTDAEIAYLVSDAAPKLFVCMAEERARFEALLAVPVATLSPGGAGTLGARFAEAAPKIGVAELAGTETAALLYTSGTTGRPKGACITHCNLALGAASLADVWSIEGYDVLLHTLPMYHAHGLLTSVNTILTGGGAIHFLDGFAIDDVLAALNDATVMMGVPTHYSRLLNSGRLAASPNRLRLAISGSAPLPVELSARFLDVTGLEIIERYGATETAIVTALPSGTTGRSGWVGWALPGVEIRVRSDDGRTSPTGVGGLETRGHNIFRGYWNNEVADRAAFTEDGWFITGDVAEIDAFGCVRLLGRSKDLVITGGLNVYPKEVEDALDALVAGGESAVFGVPHPDFGEAVVAVVESAPAELAEAEIQQSLRMTLAPYKVPKRIIAVDEIPRNRLGKVLKNALRDAHRDLFKRGTQVKK